MIFNDGVKMTVVDELRGKENLEGVQCEERCEAVCNQWATVFASCCVSKTFPSTTTYL